VVRALNPRGCRQTRVNSQRNGYVLNSDGSFEERSGRFFNLDLRAAKNFRFGERVRLSTYADFYNLFNTENLAFANRFGLSPATNPYRLPATTLALRPGLRAAGWSPVHAPTRRTPELLKRLPEKR
jgi:hypothetical protein